MLTQRSRLPQRQRRTFGAPGVRRLGRDFNLNLALSGHASRAPQCPLLGVKQTLQPSCSRGTKRGEIAGNYAQDRGDYDLPRERTTAAAPTIHAINAR